MNDQKTNTRKYWIIEKACLEASSYLPKGPLTMPLYLVEFGKIVNLTQQELKTELQELSDSGYVHFEDDRPPIFFITRKGLDYFEGKR